MRRLVFIVILVASLLSACAGENKRLPWWKVADQGEACNTAVVLEKVWSDYNPSSFQLLVKTDNGQIGGIRTNEYKYTSLEVGDNICVIIE